MEQMNMMGKHSLPPGIRFHPTDVELVLYYLKRKVMGKKFSFELISELDIYKFCPWDLPGLACSRTGDLKWYFFCPREKKYLLGGRTNRATDIGFWKATGKDRSVRDGGREVGKIKTLVFYTGRAPKGDRTNWVMHEYRLDIKELERAGIVEDSYVLCEVFQKSGAGPRIGAQYGAPFNEQDWDDDMEVQCADPSPPPPAALFGQDCQPQTPESNVMDPRVYQDSPLAVTDVPWSMHVPLASELNTLETPEVEPLDVQDYLERYATVPIWDVSDGGCTSEAGQPTSLDPEDDEISLLLRSFGGEELQPVIGYSYDC